MGFGCLFKNLSSVPIGAEGSVGRFNFASAHPVFAKLYERQDTCESPFFEVHSCKLWGAGSLQRGAIAGKTLDQ
jgi:hypothetical protein